MQIGIWYDLNQFREAIILNSFIRTPWHSFPWIVDFKPEPFKTSWFLLALVYKS